MIIKAQYELKRAEEFIKDTLHISRNWAAFRRDALSKTTGDYHDKIRTWVKKGGFGSWPNFHPLSDLDYNSAAKKWSKRGKSLTRSNYNWLLKYVSSRVNSQGTFARVRFGKGKSSAEKKLETRAGWLEGGHVTTVVDSHRRLWGATREADENLRKQQKPGGTFFPLRKTTTIIEIEPRPIMGPTYRRENQKIPRWFSDYLQATLDKYEKG